MRKQSAGLLMYRRREGELEVLLVHPGGPIWARKDLGSWSVPKGEIEEGEAGLEAAQREFYEETGFVAQGSFITLGSIRQSGGKTVAAWAFEGDCDPADLVSTLCEIVWPPRSGRLVAIPEVDRADWFLIPAARERILSGQAPLLDRLCDVLDLTRQT